MEPGMSTETESRKSRIFIVDDHALVREWLATLINQQPDLAVCGESSTAAGALELIASARPQVAIVDISMEGGSGLELIKDIKAICPVLPAVAVLVLSMHDEMLYCERALRAGARGYVMKREATKNVLQAIRCVLNGEMYVSDKMAKMMAAKFVEGKSTQAGSPVDLLSDRELEVFQLLGRGLGTRQIAEEMRIGFKTVQSLNARIKHKLNLANATALLREATRWHDGHILK
jgi:DNA-binding NarL/FixJ family response regulator